MKLKHKRYKNPLDLNTSYYFRDGTHHSHLGIKDKLLVAKIHSIILCGAHSERDLLFKDPSELKVSECFPVSPSKISLSSFKTKKEAINELREFITVLKNDVVFFQFYIDELPWIRGVTYTPVVSVFNPAPPSVGTQKYFQWIKKNIGYMIDLKYI